MDGSLRVKRKSERRGVNLAVDSAVSTRALRGPISNTDPSLLFSTDRHVLKDFFLFNGEFERNSAAGAARSRINES